MAIYNNNNSDKIEDRDDGEENGILQRFSLTEHFFLPTAKGMKVNVTFFVCWAPIWTEPTRQKNERINEPGREAERTREYVNERKSRVNK